MFGERLCLFSYTSEYARISTFQAYDTLAVNGHIHQ